MFAMTMSPKVLNVEKLEKKFASLTKSRESIQGLSMWIIRHKEFYKDIVNQWLEALSRDLNALTMFYVANDVIQNCGRKKAPEYREAFATVLEKAVSLDKVKEIKTEVTRMLTLWHERAIYDDIFYKKLQEKLNSVEESESDKEELYEADVIANFKLENLIESLRKLKTLEDELFEKEAFLEDIEEPGMSNIDNLIVKMDSQKELRKFDKFQKLVEDYISLSDKVLTAKKVALLNLKHSSIFYSAQLEDAKKVAHAYRIYGKKVKMLEKSLSEKLPTLPEPVLVLEEKSSSRELNSSLECESSGNNLESSIGNVIVENDLTTSAVDGKCKAPYVGIQNSPSAILNATEISSDGETSLKSPVILETTKNTSLEKILTSPRIVDAVKNREKILKSPIMTDAAKNNEILLKTQTIVDALKSANIEKILKSPAIVGMAKGITAVDVIKNASSEKVLKSPVIVDIAKGVTAVDTLKSANTEKILKSPVIVDIAKGITVVDAIKSVNTEKILKSPVIVDIAKGVTAVDIAKGETAVDIEKNANSKEKIVKSSAIPDKSNNEENVLKALIPDSENLTTVSSSSEISESSLTSKVVDSSDSKQASKAESQTLSDFENIDFLLEKAYNKHHNKSKASFKRKIDNLLKSKQSKACKLSKDDVIVNLYQESKTASESSDLEAAMQIEPSAVSDENNSNAKKCDISEPTVIKEESIVDIQNTSNAEKVIKASEQIENIKTDQSVEVVQSAKISDPDLSKNTPSSNSFSFPSFPDIPTELLKNILDKHRINMNLSSNAESGSSSNEISNSVTENDKGLNLNQSNIGDSSVTDDTQNSSTKVVSSNNLEPKTEDIKNNSEKMLVEDNTSNESAKKAALSANSMLDTNVVQKSSNVINSTPFLENLQNILECFTKKETAFNQLKNSETLNSLSSMPLENTLKVYNCIMQCYKNIDTLNSSNNNTVPDISSTELSSNDKFCSSETKTNINSLENVSSLKKDSSLFDNASECINSKNDNLEIMDMEVDSDDENTN